MMLTIECTGGHDFDLEVDPRDLRGLPRDAVRHGGICPTCENRLSFVISSVSA